MSSLRYALGVVALCAILVGACGNSGADGADYCDALRDVMSAAPDYGLGRALDAEIAAYLEALERAAAEAPADQEVALRDYADALRSMQADPTADGLGDRLGDALGGMLIVQARRARMRARLRRSRRNQLVFLISDGGSDSTAEVAAQQV